MGEEGRMEEMCRGRPVRVDRIRRCAREVGLVKRVSFWGGVAIAGGVV